MIGRLNHIAIAVPDLAKASELYRTVMGAKVSAPKEQPAHGVTVVFVELPNTKIELLEPLAIEDRDLPAFLQVLPWIWVVSKADVEANLGSDDGQTYLRTNTVGSMARCSCSAPGRLYGVASRSRCPRRSTQRVTRSASRRS